MDLLSIYFCPIQASIFAYLIGGIPFGWLMGKIFFQEDIRKSGSGNIGATNALRSFGTFAGILVLLLDLGKGALTVWLASKIAEPNSLCMSLVAFFVILGHIYPIWLNFQGGKGVATAAGVFLIIAPIPLFIALGAFLITVILSRYVSLGSIVAALTLLVSIFWHGISHQLHYSMYIFVAFLVALIIFKHRTNIRRLASGKENKISFRRKGTQ